jgi:hypothetical protein
MAPVFFYAQDAKPVQPFHVSPWQCEAHDIQQGCSEFVLRGDFFCLPFGKGPAVDEAEKHNPHGDTSGGLWSLAGWSEDSRQHRLSLALELSTRPGRVTRDFYLLDGHNVVYDRTVIYGFAGKTTLGHHAVLAVPDDEKCLLISVYPFDLGLTYPRPFADPSDGDYQSLAINARFESLEKIPSIFRDREDADCSAFPARRGFTDLLQIGVRPSGNEFAWTTAVNISDSYLWFALRDPLVLPSTIFWIENCGRHSAPWNGRNNSLGLEDVCSFFDRGIKASSEANAFSDRGIPTSHTLSDATPFTVNYIQGVVQTPAGFGRVKDVQRVSEGLKFEDEKGVTLLAEVQTSFLWGEEIW